MIKILTVLFPVVVVAQIWPAVAASQSLYVGGRLGLVGGAMIFEDREATDVKQPIPGIQIGGVGAYHLSPILSLQAEVWFVQKAWTETQTGGGRRLSYLELPLLVALSAPWNTAPQLLAGLSLAFELACSVTGLDSGSVDCDDAYVEWNRAKVQLGTWFGLGIEMPLGNNKLALQLLGNLNLTSVNRETLPRGYARLIGAAVSATYMFPLGAR